MKLIGLVGHAGTGKDTAAAFLPAKKFSFAGPMKEFVKRAFDFTDEQVYGASEHRNRPDPRYTRPDGVPLTPRHALQTLGTEWGRSCYENVWAEFGVRTATEWLKENTAAKRLTGWPYDDAIAVITDCRFVNEAKAIRAAGGEVWRIVRPGHVLPPEVANHPSETEQDTPEMEAFVTRTIVNDGTLERLKEKVLVLL